MVHRKVPYNIYWNKTAISPTLKSHWWIHHIISPNQRRSAFFNHNSYSWRELAILISQQCQDWSQLYQKVITQWLLAPAPQVVGLGFIADQFPLPHEWERLGFCRYEDVDLLSSQLTFSPTILSYWFFCHRSTGVFELMLSRYLSPPCVSPRSEPLHCTWPPSLFISLYFSHIHSISSTCPIFLSHIFLLLMQ
jgi:hypothetical protein